VLITDLTHLNHIGERPYLRSSCKDLVILHGITWLLYVYCPILGLRSISVIIESNRSVIGFRSVNLIEFTDISVSVNYRSVSVNSVSVSVFLFTEPIYRLYN